MIEELLNPGTLKLAVARLLEETRIERGLLQNDDSGAKQRADDSGGSESDLDQLEGEIDEYRAGEAEDLSGISGQPVWIPRDPIAALVQSTFDEFFDEFELVREPEGEQGLAGASIPVSRLELTPEAKAFLAGSKRLGGRWLTRFGERDARFLSWGAAAKVKSWLRGKHKFPDQAPPVYKIDSKDRVLLVGDWGSGIPRARQVATAMRASLEQALREGRRCHVIHLGDVYYTGQQREYKRRFLEPWPVMGSDSKTQVSSWCLNGNHDMYSGGHDYFDYLLADPRFADQGKSGYFALENEHWQILGLDSAYDDGDLHGEQASWVYQMRSGVQDKAGILMTHHQPFSSFEAGSGQMLARLRPVLNSGLVRAWFWGHEHRCAIYEKRENIEYPRLVGHGGVPVWAPAAQKPADVRFEYGRQEGEYFYRYGDERFLRLGFAELTFDEKNIEVRYVTELGTEARREVLRKET
jgi:hypothetical protein